MNSHVHRRKEIISRRSSNVADFEHLQRNDGILWDVQLVQNIYWNQRTPNDEQRNDYGTIPRICGPAPRECKGERNNAGSDKGDPTHIYVLESDPRPFAIRYLLDEGEQDGYSRARQNKADPEAPTPVGT